MQKCQAITSRGLPCGCKSKTDGYCGKHKNTPLATSIDHLRQRINAIYFLDYNNRRRIAQQPVDWIPTSIDSGLIYIGLIESLVRVDYPTWTGPITRDKLKEIQGHNPELAAVQNAVARVPVRLQHQIHLLHDWIRHFKRKVVEEYRVRAIQELNMTTNKFYDPNTIRTVIRDSLMGVWAALHITQKRELHRCFSNLNILGQTEYGNLIAVLPLPIEAVVNDFIADNQNVHRKDTVSYIEKAFTLLKKVTIPEDQKTLGEILVCCTMKPEAQVQMVKFYHAGESIYEHKNAYQRALDAVWAIIRKHENKKELYVRVADEMNDNIGMCAQGNLSRICNVLCGYLEEFKPPVPQGTLVQNAIAAIAMDSEGDKIGRAKAALRELVVPESEWSVWLDALE